MDRYCQNCGALLDEYGRCNYCTNSSSYSFQEPSTIQPIQDLPNIEYNQYLPEIECKEANLSFWTLVFPLIFAVMFSFAGIGMPIFLYTQGERDVPYFFFIPFALVGLGATGIVLYGIYKAIVISLFSKEITGTVQGYRNDNVLYNGMPGQTAEILISTYDGQKLLLYQIGGPSRPFQVGKKVRIKVYKDYFKVIKEKDTVWKNI